MPVEPWSDRLSGVVAQARSAYLLRNYQVTIDLLEERLGAEPALPGGQRILGQAFARLNREQHGVERLRAAVAQSAEDWLARASLASLLLRSDVVTPGSADLSVGVVAAVKSRAAINAGRKFSATNRPDHLLPAAEEAIAHLLDALRTEPLPGLRELLGAAEWRAGQGALEVGRFREAARLFSASTTDFLAAAKDSRAACAALPVRQSTSLVGEAVALLSAGEIETAQRLFSRRTAELIPDEPLARFAAGLYEFCDGLAGLPASERPQAVAALREVVLAVRLVVGFYDGRQAVSLAWAGGPS